MGVGDGVLGAAVGLREVGGVVCAVYIVSRLEEVLVLGHEIAMGGVWFGRRTLPQASGKWFMFAVCVYVRGSGETVVTANADMQQVVGGSEVDGGRCGW